jgi:hypothetical protein
MKLKTLYMENLTSPSYKTKHFERSIEIEIPDDMPTENKMEKANQIQIVLEELVRGDIKRHIEEFNKPEEKE